MAKIGILVLVLVAITAGGCNGGCSYTFQVKTGYLGTDGVIDFVLYQKNGTDWGSYYGVNAGSGAYHIGETDTFTVVDRLCIDPCGLLLRFSPRLLGFRSQWFCEWVNVTVSGDTHGNLVSHHEMFVVDRFFNVIFPRANISNCG